MLLEANEVAVTPGGFRLYDYVAARIELHGIGHGFSPDMAVHVVMTLGDIKQGQSVQADTTTFTLREAWHYERLYEKWRKGAVEENFFSFLLRFWRVQEEIRLEFMVNQGQIHTFHVRLGKKITLTGRFPKDVDVLATYFDPIEVLQD
jgi:hypothetical protein